MDKILQQAIESDQMILWLVMAFLFGYFIYKEWPEFKRRVSGLAVKEVESKSVTDRLSAIEADINQIKKNLIWTMTDSMTWRDGRKAWSK